MAQFRYWLNASVNVCVSLRCELRVMFEVPFVVDPSEAPVPVIEVMVNGVGPFNALIDTGNATPFTALVSRSAAANAKLVESGFEQPTLMVRQGESQQSSIRQALNNTLTIKGREWPDARIGIMHAREHLSVLPSGKTVDVVLGAAFLSERVIAIDFQRRIVDLEAQPGRSGGISFSLNYRQPLLIVDAHVNESDALPMVLDTGSPITTVWTPVAESAKLPTSMTTALLSEKGQIENITALARRFELAGHVRCNQIVAVSDSVGDLGIATRQMVMGQIGADVLANGRLTIDYPKQRLWFRQTGRPQKCNVAVQTVTDAAVETPAPAPGPAS
jgi:Aspartyl protease